MNMLRVRLLCNCSTLNYHKLSFRELLLLILFIDHQFIMMRYYPTRDGQEDIPRRSGINYECVQENLQ